MAAIAFVLEEIIGDLNSRYMGGLLLASVLGAFMVHGIIGRQPSFLMPHVDTPTWIGYALTPWSRRWRRWSACISSAPRWGCAPGTSARAACPLGAAGNRRIDHLGAWSRGLPMDRQAGCLRARVWGPLGGPRGGIGWKIAGILLVAKFIATFACYGFGGCGGIFSPTLFFGEWWASSSPASQACRGTSSGRSPDPRRRRHERHPRRRRSRARDRGAHRV